MEWNGVYGCLALGQGWAGGGCKGVRRLITQFQDCHYPRPLSTPPQTPLRRFYLFCLSLSRSLRSLRPLLCASFRNVNSINATSWGVFFFFFFFSSSFLSFSPLCFCSSSSYFFFGGGGFGGKNRKRSVFLEIFYMFIYSYEWEWTRKIDWKCNIHVWILSILFF